MKQERIVRVLRVLLMSGVVGMACTPGERPPAAPVRGTLALGGERAGKRDDDVFRVVFAAPQGEATSVAEMSIVFSRPLHALEVAGGAPVPPITITPPIPGRWLWVGARGLRFVPEMARLPGASRFVVEVPGTVQALDGTRLGAPYRFELGTPRPKVVTSSPRDGEDGLALGTTFTLEMSQPIDPARFEKATTLVSEHAGKKQKLGFTAVRPDPRESKKIVVRPRAPLPKDSAITLQISDALVGDEGPLPTGETTTLAYRTYGPLAIERIDCDRDTPRGGCAPGGSIGLSLTNQVRWKDLRRAVTVTPAVKLRLGGGDAEDFTRYLDLSGAFEAGRSYTITLAADLTDRYGQTLGKPESRPIAIDDFFPRAEIGLVGDTLLPSGLKPIQIGSINLSSYLLTTSALGPEDLQELFTARTPEEKLQHVQKLRQALQRRVAPRAGKNHVAKDAVSPRQILGADHGVLAIGVEYDRDRRDYHSVDPFRLLKVTELAVSAKVSRHGSILWVTRLATSEPVKGASVEVIRGRGGAAKRYTTDDSGFATIPASDYAPNLNADGPDAHATFVVRSGEDWTYERVEEHLPEWRLPVSVDLSGEQHAYGMLFTERGVYRPGDTVRLKGIVRQETPTGNANLAGKALTVVLRSPEDEEISRTAVTTTRFGTFSASVVVPSSASLGSFHLRAEGLGGEDTVDDSFEVAEYRPAEFKVSVESNAPSYVHGGTARWTVKSDYLFGAPMAKASAHYSVTRGQTWFSVPDSEGFSTDASAYYADLGESALSAGEIAAADAKLDAHGSFTFDAKLALPGQRTPELVRVDAEVTDVSRQAISASAAAIVHPADFYLGLETPEDYFVTTPGDLSARVLALTFEGKRLSGKRVHVDLVQRRWTFAHERLHGGEEHSIAKVVDRVAGGCDVTTGADAKACALHVDASGYYLVVARARDAHGNVAEAAYGMYATGGAGASWGDSDRGLVELVPNKKSYKMGDVARVLVKSPFAEAQALVTVERAGVYHAERVTLRGPTPTVSVPITEDLRPNAFVSVHLLRPMRGKGTGPYYRVGYAALSIDAEARRLSVEVKPRRRELLPGEEVTIDLVARGKGGKAAPTELTVYAVDEGVLMLTGYKTPDPLPVFTAARALQVATLETRESMAKISLDAFEGALGSDKGADGGGGGEGGARRDFRQTAYFNPSVLTDASGRATVTFKLPETLTTYRVMAVATTEADQYGFGQANVVTSRRLMARPNLPRFLRAGDRVDAGIVVSSKGLPATRVTVRAAVKGVTLDGASEKVVDLGRDESIEVRFSLRADTVGDAKLRFDVSAGAERDAVEVSRHVSAPGTLETVASYGSTEKTSAEALGDYGAIRHDTGGLEVTLASSALVGLDGGAAQLVEYPYACTEQLSSRLLPLLPLRDLATAFGFALPPDVNGVVGRTIGEILSRQRGDGGFGMWPESTESTAWISAYATWVLDQASAHGARISKNARARAHAYLRKYLAALDGNHARLATAAFIVDVLADASLPDPGYMARLFDVRKELPTFGRGFLLHALAVGKGPASTVKQLARELSSELRITNDAAFVAENVGDEYAVLLDSEARTGAIVLRGLLAADPKLSLGSQLARGLVSQRSHGTWRTTQETAFALVALDAYRRAQEASRAHFSAKVWLGDKTIRSATFTGKLSADHSFMDLAKLPDAGALVFAKEGSGRLFYETRLRYVRRTLPATPLDAGFFVQKALRAVDPASLKAALGTIADKGSTRFGAGNLVLADLVVVTPSPRDYVVIDDPLPAGFEAVDSGLATTAAWLDVPSGTSTADEEDCEGCESGRDALAHGRAFLESWYRREVRDDRVLFFVDHMPAGMYHYRYLARATTLGTFIVPSTKAEEMYTPETFGRTGAETVVVQ